MQFSGTLFPENFFNISTLDQGGGARPSAPRRGAPGGAPWRGIPSKNNCFCIKNTKKYKKNWLFFSTFFDYQNFDLFFRLFLTFFQILSQTWGINFDTIACLFEPVYGPKKHFFSTENFFSKWPGNQKFPSKSTVPDSKKYSRRLKPSYLFFFVIFSEISKKMLEIK